MATYPPYPDLLKQAQDAFNAAAAAKTAAATAAAQAIVPPTDASAAHPQLTIIGHSMADWLLGIAGKSVAASPPDGKGLVGFVDRNFIGVFVAGVALYMIFAPDVAGTSRV